MHCKLQKEEVVIIVLLYTTTKICREMYTVHSANDILSE